MKPVLWTRLLLVCAVIAAGCSSATDNMDAAEAGEPGSGENDSPQAGGETGKAGSRGNTSPSWNPVGESLNSSPFVVEEQPEGAPEIAAASTGTHSGQTVHGGAAASSAWPQFRGPRGRGVSRGSRLPVRWSPQQNIAWKTKLPGAGTSSPVVRGVKVYLTAHTGYGVDRNNPGTMDDLELRLLCLDAEDGNVLWRRSIEPRLPVQEYGSRMHWHGYASSTPAVDDERVYAFFGNTGVFAFNHEGGRLWQADVGSGTHGWGSAASPILYKNLVILNAFVESGDLVALNRETGEEVWRAGGLKESWNTPVLVDAPDGGTELVVGSFGKIFGLHPQTGERLWSSQGPGWYIVGSAAVCDGVAYYVAGNQYEAVAVRAGGRGDVTGTHRLWTLGKGSNVSSPICHEGHLFWAHEKLGIVYCADAETGELVYEERLSPGPGYIYASPIVGDGRIYYVSRNGTTVVLPAEPRFEVLARNTLDDDGEFNATPAVSDGRLLLRSDRFLYCIGRTNDQSP